MSIVVSGAAGKVESGEFNDSETGKPVKWHKLYVVDTDSVSVDELSVATALLPEVEAALAEGNGIVVRAELKNGKLRAKAVL